MKKQSLSIFLVLLMSGACSEQSKLSKCESDDYKQWINCFGTYTNEMGHEYTGEFGNNFGEKHGKGTLIVKNVNKYVQDQE